MQLIERQCRERERQPSKGSDERWEREPDLGFGRGWFVCAECAERLAHESWVLTSAASEPLVFANPHGKLFHLVLLRRARRVVFDHHSTAEHTWFSGYTWRVGVCGSCRGHVGWLFEALRAALEPPEFVALSRAAVRFVHRFGGS